MNNDVYTIQLDTYHAVKTYAGSYEGRPSSKDMLMSARSDIERTYGKGRTIYVVPPTIDAKDSLPTWHHMAWMMSWSPTPEDPEAHGSDLFVVWFSDNPPGKEDLTNVCANIDWEKQAKTFYI